MSAVPEHVPWHDELAEMAVIASVLSAFTLAEDGLSDNGQSVWSRASAIIPDPSAFYLPAHRTLWEAIRRLQAEGRPATLLRVRACLNDLGEDGAHAQDVLMEIPLERWASGAHIEDHAEIVAEMDRRRRLEYATAGLIENLRGGASAADAARAIEAALQKISTPASSNLFETGETACAAQSADVPWDVESMLPSGSLVLLASEPKVGKTTLLAHVVAAALAGKEVIGLACRHQPAVVWLSEEAKATIQHPLRAAGAASPNLHLLLRSHMNALPWGQAVSAAAKKAEDTKAGILIIDTLSAWAGFRGEEENHAGTVEAAISPLKRISARGVSVILVHHISKAPDRKGVAAIRGSSALTGAVDGYLLLRKVGQAEDSSVRSLQGAGRGDGWANGIHYELDASGRLLRIEDRLQVASAVLGKKILDYLQAQPGITCNVLHKEVGGRKQSVLDAVRDLERQGRLRVQGDGSNGSPTIIWPT